MWVLIALYPLQHLLSSFVIPALWADALPYEPPAKSIDVITIIILLQV